jgi:ubiquinone biosynthesis protein
MARQNQLRLKQADGLDSTGGYEKEDNYLFVGTANRVRYFEIVGVLARHGLGFAESSAGSSDRFSPARMRAAMEELGPTFVKLGQVLSTRSDLIPLIYVREFEKLQEEVIPFSLAEVRQTIREELNDVPERLFLDFDPQPIAAASMGQVHRAKLATGSKVVVKVQRPGIEQKITADLDILEQLAGVIRLRSKANGTVQIDDALSEMRRMLACERDYTREASHLERFRLQFQDISWTMTPRVYREFSSQRVLTMDYIEGAKPTDVAALEAMGCDRREVARRGAELLARQIFEHGFFHGDPHPGNLRVLPRNTLCWLDYGLMGEIPATRRRYYADLLLAFAARDRQRVLENLVRVVEPADAVDMGRLDREIGDLLQNGLDRDSGELRMVFQRFFSILSDHAIRIPSNLFLVLKAVGAVDSLTRALEPSFNLFRYSERWLNSQSSRGIFIERVASIPGEIHEILSRVRDGSFSVRLAPTEWQSAVQPLVSAQQRSGIRIVGAILAGCGGIALAVLMAAEGWMILATAICAMLLLTGVFLLLKK